MPLWLQETYANLTWNLRNAAYKLVANGLKSTVPIPKCCYFVMSWPIEELVIAVRESMPERGSFGWPKRINGSGKLWKAGQLTTGSWKGNWDRDSGRFGDGGDADLAWSRPDGLKTPYVSGEQNKKGKYWVRKYMKKLSQIAGEKWNEEINPEKERYRYGGVRKRELAKRWWPSGFWRAPFNSKFRLTHYISSRDSQPVSQPAKRN